MVIPPEEEMDGWKGFYEWGDRAGGGMQGLPNPWENAGNPAMAPFDEAVSETQYLNFKYNTHII